MLTLVSISIVLIWPSYMYALLCASFTSSSTVSCSVHVNLSNTHMAESFRGRKFLWISGVRIRTQVLVGVVRRDICED